MQLGEINNVITAQNNIAIQTVLAIAKQDAALEIAINSLNELIHTRSVEFTSYGKQCGVSEELMQKVIQLKEELENAKYGRF